MDTYEVQTAARVPTGMLCSGLWRSELMLNPAITPIHTHRGLLWKQDKGPSKTWTTDRCTLSELTWNTFLTSNRSEKETLITNQQLIWATQGPNQSFSLLQEAEVGLYCVWQNKTRMEIGNMGFFLHVLDHYFISLVSNFICTVFINGLFCLWK